jgi:hypothetical protein
LNVLLERNIILSGGIFGGDTIKIWGIFVGGIIKIWGGGGGIS